jgi:hypothetical protein
VAQGKRLYNSAEANRPSLPERRSVPKRSAPHGQQPRRKRGRRRHQPLAAAATAGNASSGPDAAGVATFPGQPQPRTEGQRLQARLAAREHHYVGRELARIAMIAVVILILLAILTFVL